MVSEKGGSSCASGGVEGEDVDASMVIDEK